MDYNIIHIETRSINCLLRISFYFRYLHPESFDGLTSVMYLSLADNDMDQVPEQLWRKMPNLKTLDLGRTKIGHLYESSFRVGITR